MRIQVNITDTAFVTLFTGVIELGGKAVEIVVEDATGAYRPLLVFLSGVERPDPLADHHADGVWCVNATCSIHFSRPNNIHA